MLVKIGNTITDSSKEPIMLTLTSTEKFLIASMDQKQYNVCFFEGDRFSSEEIKTFMGDSR